LSTWAGVRPVVSDGAAGRKPSDETREHALWIEPGCVTLAGGKLTTFRLLALEVLRACAGMLGRPLDDQGAATFRPCMPVPMPRLSPAQQRRLAGSDTLWVELAWAAQNELVLHLDDLLLRRTRLGLLLAGGARAELPRIRALCQARLGWDDERWESEERDYLELWRNCYSLPPSV
jgi:glycerol-3-phosphate dehydrogenase